MADTINLECKGCGRSMRYLRRIDPAIPARVAKIVQGRCDRCWNGDFDTETWFDARGKEVAQTANAS